MPVRIKDGLTNEQRYRLRHPGKDKEARERFLKAHPDASKKHQRRSRAYRRAETDAYKVAKGCRMCGERDLRCLVFHHRDPSQKKFNVGEGVSRCYDPQVLWDEVEKCDVLCANCHSKITWDAHKARL